MIYFGDFIKFCDGDPSVRKISDNSMRVGRSQNLVNPGVSLPVIMSMGRWIKADAVMRYVEQISSEI